MSKVYGAQGPLLNVVGRKSDLVRGRAPVSLILKFMVSSRKPRACGSDSVLMQDASSTSDFPSECCRIGNPLLFDVFNCCWNLALDVGFWDGFEDFVRPGSDKVERALEEPIASLRPAFLE